MDANTVARRNLEKVINDGKANAQEAIARVMDSQPTDYLVAGRKMVFDTGQEGVRLNFDKPQGGTITNALHNHALGQCTSVVNMPKKYADNLLSKGEWGQSLLALNLNTLYGHQDTRHLVRTVHGEVRGFMSDKYKRISTPQCLEAFVGAMQKYGAVPAESRCLATKFSLSAVVPEIFEPFPGEPIIIGVSLKHSDFGHGAYNIQEFIMRLLCLNGMVGVNALRKVHLGARLGEELELSQKTYDLDNDTMVSATTDVVDGLLNPDHVRDRIKVLRAANETKISLKSAIEDLRKGNKVTKGEAEKITEVFIDGGVEELPPGNTTWRLSNAISSFAKNEVEVDPYRKLELQALAGSVAGLN